MALHAAPRDHSFSLVHVSDLVGALILAAEHPAAAGKLYFVGESPVTWHDLYDEVARTAHASPIQLQVPLSALRIAARASDLLSTITGRVSLLNKNKAALARPRWWLCDASRVREELGWHPTMPLQRGVQETYLWYVNAGWLRPPKPATTEGLGEERKA